MFKKPFKWSVNFIWRFDKNFELNYISYNPDMWETALRYNWEWIIVDMDLRDKFKLNNTIEEIKQIFIDTPKEKYSFWSTINKDKIKEI